jgi:hypothetical protein
MALLVSDEAAHWHSDLLLFTFMFRSFSDVLSTQELCGQERGLHKYLD